MSLNTLSVVCTVLLKVCYNTISSQCSCENRVHMINFRQTDHVGKCEHCLCFIQYNKMNEQWYTIHPCKSWSIELGREMSKRILFRWNCGSCGFNCAQREWTVKPNRNIVWNALTVAFCTVFTGKSYDLHQWMLLTNRAICERKVTVSLLRKQFAAILTVSFRENSKYCTYISTALILHSLHLSAFPLLIPPEL